MNTKPSPSLSLPKAPRYEELPSPERRAARGGPELHEFGVRLEVVTPIFGGSYRVREIDDVDFIRVPSVRGQLRFWWRALYASQCTSAEELHQRESMLWGCAATDEARRHGGARSRVEIRIGGMCLETPDTTKILPSPSRGQPATPGAYALWPAREERSTNTPTAPRRKPGTRFQLTLRVPRTAETEVENALRAWILFGGYGGRTRRGLGSLKALDNQNRWLPNGATHAALTSLFGVDVFAVPAKAPGDVPWLGGAALHIGNAQRHGSAQAAWTTALGWLSEFRQGTGPGDVRAREPSSDPRRPSRSNWPEADKVRHLTKKTGSHKPQHNATPAWPRAGFGLPINGRFQTQGRDNQPYDDEPRSFHLQWRAGTAEYSRLASPLIVKAMALADGTFVPCALWLNRAYPANGQVFLHSVNNSQAPFDRLVAEGDKPRFAALAGKSGLRQAFLDWLWDTYETRVEAP